ncbi:MAG: AAA family ATPase [Myxococcota bacterium]
MADATSFRVYLTVHHDKRISGQLMRSKENWVDGPPPSGYGATAGEVLEELEARVLEALAKGENLDRYLWTERFHTRRVALEVNPRTMVDTMPVVGHRVTPLRLWYAYSKHKSEAYRVMLPRWGWWALFEALEDVAPVLRSLVSSALTGKSPAWLFDFREEGKEEVIEWAPDRLLERVRRRSSDALMDPPPVELSKVADDWIAKARQKRLPLVIGEDEHSARITELIQDGLRPILLVGEPGVGKTAILRKTAKNLMRDKPPVRIWASSTERILAGMVYLGMWQERCIKLVNELSNEGDWLYIDELASLIRPLADGTSVADAFIGSIVGREFGFLAECTPSELTQARRTVPTLIDACEIIEVRERSRTAMLELLQFYQLRTRSPAVLSPPAIDRIVEYLDRYVRATRFPGKGFAFLEWLHRQSEQARTTEIDPGEATRRFSRYTGLPERLVADDYTLSRRDIEEGLSARVIGQREAVAVSARVLARFKAGMTDPDRPIGSLCFVGPTGVGKTELAKQLARFAFGTADRMVRFDMAEYGHRGAAQRLLQVGDGIRSLATQLTDQPLTLVLFDEIEKAHSEVFDLLLGVLGEGRLTNADGRLVDARSALFVMTSNLGAGKKPAAGFGARQGASYDRAVREHFRPEFFNRIDHVVSFKHLTPDDVARIVDLELEQVRVRRGLKRRGLTLTVSSDARRWLAAHGYHPTWGARPLRRLIEERIVSALAVQLAKNPALRDRTLHVALRDDLPLLVP